MKNVLFVIAGILLSISISAQKSQGGFPIGLGKTDLPVLNATFKLPLVNSAQLLAEDAQLAAAGEKSLRFGQDINVDITTSSHGQWNTLSDGRKIWRLKIKSTGAKSLNFIFDRYKLNQGEKLFIYSVDASRIQGAFTEANNNRIFNFATLPISAPEVIIEFIQPANSNTPDFRISSIIHGYRDFNEALKDFGDSGGCNNNVVCPEGDEWYNQRKGVVMLLTSNNSRFCTGSAVNNTANDGTPYVLTANHCDAGVTDIFMFNYFSPTCTPNADGTTNDVVVGCTPRANNSGSDFALVELASEIPAEFEAYLNGWSRQETPALNTTCIHHPQGDVKKITFNTDDSEIAQYSGADCWHIFDWEDGTTEPGSSGSPLFNENKLIIGQLYGGTATCNNNIDDYFGRFATSWDGSNANRRLHDWLDPANTDATSLEGRPANVPTLGVDVRLSQIITPLSNYCNTEWVEPKISVRNGGLQTITSFTVEYSFGNSGTLTYNWTGSLLSLQAVEVTLPPLNMPLGNAQMFTAAIVNPNQVADEDDSNNQRSLSVNVALGAQYGLTIVSDNYPEETSWELQVAGSGEVIESLALGDLAQGTSNFQWCLAPGCYKFIIGDDYGDGICCGFFSGNGSFSVFNNNDSLLGTGGNFNFSDEVDFCVDSSAGILHLNYSSAQFAIYPNPVREQLSIRSLSYLKSDKANVQITDISGKIIVATTFAGGNGTINTSGWASGVYLVRVFTQDSVMQKKIVVSH